MPRDALFYTFLVIFAVTALVTLLGVTQKVRIEAKYLNGLFGALLLELTGAVIGLYKGVGKDFFTQPAPISEATITNETFPGTRWTLSDGIFSTIVILREGKFINFGVNLPAEANLWELHGSNVVLKANNGYATYTGIVKDNNSMEGTATNLVGKQGKWSAQRVR